MKPEFRGGFLDLWEGANEFEWTTHPYEGTIFDRDGKEITFKDEYRVDFVTDRAERFLKEKRDGRFYCTSHSWSRTFKTTKSDLLGLRARRNGFTIPACPMT